MGDRGSTPPPQNSHGTVISCSPNPRGRYFAPAVARMCPPPVVERLHRARECLTRRPRRPCRLLADKIRAICALELLHARAVPTARRALAPSAGELAQLGGQPVLERQHGGVAGGIEEEGEREAPLCRAGALQHTVRRRAQQPGGHILERVAQVDDERAAHGWHVAPRA
eukprot:3890711-Prymnesium_polylepis.1